MPDLLRYGLLCLTVLITNFQEGVTGFGCTALALPFAIMLFGLDVAKPVLVLVGVVVNIGNVIMSRKQIVWNEYLHIVLLTGCGLPVGMWLAEKLPETILKLILAVFMVGVGTHGLLSVGGTLPHKISTRRRMLLSGFLPLGGVIHGAFASGGPLIVIYATRALADKGIFRGTLSFFWLTLSIALIASWTAQGIIRAPHLHIALVCLPFTLVGLYFGNRAHHRLPDLAFKRMVYSVLVISGIAVAMTAK